MSPGKDGSTIAGDFVLGPLAKQEFESGQIDGQLIVDPTSDNGRSNSVVISGGTIEPGQMVAASTGLVGGGYAEYLCLPADDLVPVPDGIDPAEAVCVVANYLTAHLALHETAHVRSGERILVQGAAGGSGHGAAASRIARRSRVVRNGL